MTELIPNVHWLSECFELPDKHLHISVYLLENEDGYVLVDTGSHIYSDEIIAAVRSVIGDAPLETIVVSHADLPHSGNIEPLKEEWDDPEVVAASATPEVVGLPETRRCTFDEKMLVGGREFTFFDPPLADVVFTSWPYDHETGTLFTADGFGTYHEPSTCEELWTPTTPGLGRENLESYHETTFRWLEYVDPDLLIGALEEMLDNHDISLIAPSHGNPIRAEHVDEYFEQLSAVITDYAATA